MKDDRKRRVINSFLAQKITAAELAEAFPNCECESAPSQEGSPGPVQDDEKLRLFLTSRSDIDGKKPNQLKNRTFRATSLRKAYTSGLSTYRLAHASVEELERSAKIIYDNKSKEDPEYGGILDVMDFPASAVRKSTQPEAVMCVLETPLDKIKNNEFLRPSHCDVVSALPLKNQEDRVAARRIIFNQIKEQGQQQSVQNISDCDLKQFLPKILRSDP